MANREPTDEEYQAEVKELHDKISNMLEGRTITTAVHVLGVLLWDLIHDEDYYSKKLTVEERIDIVFNNIKDVIAHCMIVEGDES